MLDVELVSVMVLELVCLLKLLVPKHYGCLLSERLTLFELLGFVGYECKESFELFVWTIVLLSPLTVLIYR